MILGISSVYVVASQYACIYPGDGFFLYAPLELTQATFLLTFRFNMIY